MAINQMQTIQSLGNNLAMLQQEVEVFGVSATEKRHLVGRIGELYACVITNGQMAPNTDEKGYDVVSNIGERISVKTTATTTPNGGATFNQNTLEFVDRVMIMRINEDLEIEVLFDAPTDEAKELMHNGTISYSKLLGTGRNNINLDKIPIIKEVEHGGYKIVEYENGSITVHEHGKMNSPAKPILRELAANLNIPIVNSNGNQHNTRTLGSQVINAVITHQN
ncbi:MAG: hypothetical protein ACJAS1_007259 [Oleiphilaceae bacterium]|jgi:hypothetical protein